MNLTMLDLVMLKRIFPDHAIYECDDGTLICPSCSGIAGFPVGVLIVPWHACPHAPKEVDHASEP